MTFHSSLALEGRRRFLTNGFSGAAAIALSQLLQLDGFTPSRAQGQETPPGPLTPTSASAIAPRAKRCIYIYLEGGPSQMDLFDPKPLLNDLDGQPPPPSLVENMQFAFLQKETARLMGSPRTFRKYGECGMDFSDLLPHLATCADDITQIRSMQSDQFNHLPAQLLFNCGSSLAGRPSVGSWLSYGLGSETQDLPAYVSMVTTGRGIPGGSASWSSGFLPSVYSGVLFGNDGQVVLNLDNPSGVTPAMQRDSIAAINDLNRLRQRSSSSDLGTDARDDSELASRISAYELAFRMQSTAPELIDLSQETQATLDAYGIDRKEPVIKSNRGGIGKFGTFARNCLLARRLVERGVRVVNIIHSSWDHHSRLDPELTHNALMVDQPIAALLKDLKARGLLEDTLVVWGSEFGRTPLGENRSGFKSVTGRDHHPNAFTLWLAGGGVKGGQVVGASDDIGWNVTETPVHVHDLHATLLYLFGIDHTQLTYRFQGRDFRLTDVHGRIVHELFA